MCQTQVTYVWPAEMGWSSQRGDDVFFGADIIDHDIVHVVVAAVSSCLCSQRKQDGPRGAEKIGENERMSSPDSGSEVNVNFHPPLEILRFDSLKESVKPLYQYGALPNDIQD